MAALPPRTFHHGLEVGCSIGVLTSQLATHCDHLLSLDVADAALVQARERNPGVQFERRQIPEDWPPGRFDLIVFSEVLYYLDRAAIERTAELSIGALQPRGCILLVHYLGETDYPMSGDEAAEAFIAASRLNSAIHIRNEGYRIDRLDDASEG